MARIKKALAATAVMLVTVTSCSGGNDSASEDAGSHPAQDKAGSAPAAGAEDTGGTSESAGGSESGGTLVDTAAVQGRDIVHTVDLTVATDDIEAAANHAVSVAEGAGGYVADQSSRNERTNLTLKIPAEAHKDAVGELEQLGEVVSLGRTAEDVTDQVVDTESRIESQRATIARTRELLETATDIDQVIRIEEELSRREADLDALLRTREELSALTSLATVEVSFRVPEEDDTVTTAGFTGGLRDGWATFLDVLSYGSHIIGAALPFLAVLAIIGLPAVWWWRRRTGKPGLGVTLPRPAHGHSGGDQSGDPSA